MAAANRGVDRDDLLQRQGRAAVMDSREAVPFRRELCKIAAHAFAVCEESHKPVAVLFSRLANTEDWHDSYNGFTDCVLRSLSKQAGALLGGAMALHDKTGGGVMKTLAATGALGGAALGSIAFMLARNAEQSSAENNMLLEKVRAYKQLKRDIQEDMGEEYPELREAQTQERYDV